MSSRAKCCRGGIGSFTNHAAGTYPEIWWKTQGFCAHFLIIPNCRSATVILIVDSILHVRIAEAPKAMPDYPSAPAPSPRALWDAESELDWAVGYAGHLDANARHGMLRNGDLVALKEEAGDQNDRWYEYADSFGLLVTLAARLII